MGIIMLKIVVRSKLDHIWESIEQTGKLYANLKFVITLIHNMISLKYAAVWQRSI